MMLAPQASAIYIEQMVDKPDHNLTIVLCCLAIQS